MFLFRIISEFHGRAAALVRQHRAVHDVDIDDAVVRILLVGNYVRPSVHLYVAVHRAGELRRGSADGRRAYEEVVGRGERRLRPCAVRPHAARTRGRDDHGVLRVRGYVTVVRAAVVAQVLAARRRGDVERVVVLRVRRGV